MYRECLQHSALLHCVYALPQNTAPKLYRRVRIGLYYVHLAVLQSVYPQDNIFVLRFENYMHDQPLWLRKIMKFLNVSLMSKKDIRKLLNEIKVANANKSAYKKHGAMLNETRDLLQHFYHPYNVLVDKYLDTNTMNW